MTKTLFINLNAVGDVIRSTAVAEALRARGDDVTFCANETCAPVLAGLPFAVLPNPRGRIRDALRRRHPPFEIVLDETAAWLESLGGRWDLVVNAHGTVEAGAIAGAARAPRRRGLVVWAGEEADPWTEWRQSLHATGWGLPIDAVEAFALVAGVSPATLGPPEPAPPEGPAPPLLSVADDERARVEAALGRLPRPLVALPATAGDAAKALRADEAATLAERLAADLGAGAGGAGVVLLGAPYERRFLDAVGRRAPSAAAWRPADLREAAAAVSLADVVVTVDTWAAHAAAALGRPAVVLQRRTRVAPWGANPCAAVVCDDGVDAPLVASIARALVEGGAAAVEAAVVESSRPLVSVRATPRFRPLAPRHAPAEAASALLGAAHLIGWEGRILAESPDEPSTGLDTAAARASLGRRFDAAALAAGRARAAEAAAALRAFRDRLAGPAGRSGPDPLAALAAARDGLPPDLAAATAVPATALRRVAGRDAEAGLRDATADLAGGIAEALRRLSD